MTRSALVVDFGARDRFVRKSIMDAYRRYIGPSGAGMTDKELQQLATFGSFLAGFDAGRAYGPEEYD